MEKDNELETGILSIGDTRDQYSQVINGQDNVRDNTKLQEGSLCPLVHNTPNIDSSLHAIVLGYIPHLVTVYNVAV